MGSVPFRLNLYNFLVELSAACTNMPTSCQIEKVALHIVDRASKCSARFRCILKLLFAEVPFHRKSILLAKTVDHFRCNDSHDSNSG